MPLAALHVLHAPHSLHWWHWLHSCQRKQVQDKWLHPIAGGDGQCNAKRLNAISVLCN